MAELDAAALFAALAQGATALTPNRRLARETALRFADGARRAGLAAWETPRILPWRAWLSSLWNASGRSHGLALPIETAWLWTRVVAQDPGAALLVPAGAAATAEEAWSLFHAWREPGDAIVASLSAADAAGDDVAAFGEWSLAYRRELERRNLVDLARVADLIAADAAGAFAAASPFVLVGFIELTPQQRRLVAAMERNDVLVHRATLDSASTALPCRVVAANPRDEVASALRWARALAAEHPSARIGIAVEDLAARRDEIFAQARDILEPSTWIEPREARARTFDVSLGTPLAAVPLAQAALELILLASRKRPAETIAALLRSPYLGGASAEWTSRSRIESWWIDGGRHDVSVEDVLSALTRISPALAAGLGAGRAALPSVRASHTPHEWVDAWRAWLDAAGWPGDRALSSDEFQARRAWSDLLVDFASLARVAPRLKADEALDLLLRLAQRTIFQPEVPAARIQILGILEAAGVPFDELWVAGLTSDRWPPATAPNPFLPVAWQRRRRVPRSGPERSLEFAKALTAALARGGRRVVFSAATHDGEQPLRTSSLLAAWPQAPLPSPDVEDFVAQIAASSRLEQLEDDFAPRLAPGSDARGGARLIASQADCPFQAFARHRLLVEPWDLRGAGLGRDERGILAHAALAQFWEKTHDRRRLLALDDTALGHAIDVAVQGALATMRSARLRALPLAIRAGEARRLAEQVADWLRIERERLQFSVLATEQSLRLVLGGIRVSLRVDRVDLLDDDGIAIIDYKTGRVDMPSGWFRQRPRSPQLGMYVLAMRALEPTRKIRATLYAQLCAGEVRAVGIAADETAWPGLTVLGAKRPALPPSWRDAEAFWQEHLEALASEVAQGVARVAPLDGEATCGRCGLQPLCRIRSAVTAIPLATTGSPA